MSSKEGVNILLRDIIRYRDPIMKKNFFGDIAEEIAVTLLLLSELQNVKVTPYIFTYRRKFPHLCMLDSKEEKWHSQNQSTEDRMQMIFVYFCHSR